MKEVTLGREELRLHVVTAEASANPTPRSSEARGLKELF